MPTNHGVTFTQAYVEAAMINRASSANLDALELYHPLVGRMRFVDDNQSLFATLEPGAPDGGGTEIEWLPKPFRLKPPDESDAADNPDWSIEVDNMSGAISAALKTTRGSLVPWVLTARVYTTEDTSGPAQLPATVVELRSVATNEKSVQMVFNYGDPGNVGIPALTFKRALYPGLVR